MTGTVLVYNSEMRPIDRNRQSWLMRLKFSFVKRQTAKQGDYIRLCLLFAIRRLKQYGVSLQASLSLAYMRGNPKVLSLTRKEQVLWINAAVAQW